MPPIKLKSLLSESLLDEMPVSSFNPIGFDKNPKTGETRSHSFRDKKDRDLITNPTNIQKTKDFFKNVDVEFDFYFVNKIGVRKHAEVGSVNMDFITKNLGITKDQLFNGETNEDGITVFYVGNSAAEKTPMTSWTIAHRFAHSIRNTYGFTEYTKWLEHSFNSILKDYNQSPKDNIKATLFNQIGTMRSARQGKIKRYFEFYYELFAQYLKTGGVKFNKLDKAILVGHGAWGRKQYANTNNIDYVNEALSNIERDFYYYANDALNGVIGGIFVM